jgi:glycosyltransferase involved in cell wall biosynthesis
MISIIICTYNRDRVLEETVRSFLESQTEGIDHELLIVDNNSTDGTREISERYAMRHPQIRYLNEPLQGHPYAKNRGIRESRGDIIAFVDDDVFFSDGWLPAVDSSFERHPDVGCIGGRVIPHFEIDRPSWVEDEILWIYGITRYGDREREIRPPEIPIGCNMAFRRSVFEQLGDFHTSLGRTPGSLLSGDEDHFLHRVVNAGMKIFYSPDAQVSHRIPPVRLTRKWVLSRFYWGGVSVVALKQVTDDPLPRIVLTKRAIRKVLGLVRPLRDASAFLAARFGLDGRMPMTKQADVCYRLGELRQMVAEAIAVPKRKAGNGGPRRRDGSP